MNSPDRATLSRGFFAVRKLAIVALHWALGRHARAIPCKMRGVTAPEFGSIPPIRRRMDLENHGVDPDYKCRSV